MIEPRDPFDGIPTVTEALRCAFWFAVEVGIGLAALLLWCA